MSETITQYIEETIDFLLVDDNDHVTGRTGLTVTVEISKNNGPFATAEGVITELAYGWYSIKLTKNDTSVLGSLKFHITAPGADPVDFKREVVAADSDATTSPTDTLTGSYCSVGEADNYFQDRLFSSLWDTESQENKEKALKTATRYIDHLFFKGEKTDSEQELEFPRDGDTTIPIAIKNATCELALILLDGRDVEYESENLNMQRSGFGPGGLSKDTQWIPENIVHGIPSVVAWRFLLPYLDDGQMVSISRVS